MKTGYTGLSFLIQIHLTKEAHFYTLSGRFFFWRFRYICSPPVCKLCFFPSLHSSAAFMFPRQPSPTGYHNNYQLYAMENTRQTILNDYITSQQMQVIPRPDVARGLSPREQPVIPYPAAARGMALHQLLYLQHMQGRGHGCVLVK